MATRAGGDAGFPVFRNSKLGGAPRCPRNRDRISDCARIAWAFELTPEGLKRTEDVDLAAAAQRPRHRAWIVVVIIAGAMSLGLFMLGRYGFREKKSVLNETSAKSIAVLPFENLSRDPDNAYFVDGTQD